MNQESKNCSKCGDMKPLDEFFNNESSPDGKYSQCRKCRKAVYKMNQEKILEEKKSYYERNKEKKKASVKEYRKRKKAENPNWKKLKEMAYKTGKSFEEVEQWFNKQWMKQQAQCSICGKVFSDDDCIDHDHNTNQLRGLLCPTCNAGIGMLKDSSELCLNASKYLNNNFN